jgi:glycosyltransferase involved in cell wall biosynthesis
MADINYISNLPVEEKSGGGSSVNYNTIQELSKYFSLNIFPPINPSPIFFENIISKVQKLVQIHRQYYFFSEKRLNSIAEQVKSYELETSDYIFFHGSTPWVKLQPQKPYGIHVDACFKTYLDIYNPNSAFKEKDIQRIISLEKSFFSNASHVFFRSQWALNETVTAYGISSQNMFVTGRGGGINIPKDDEINVEGSSTPPYFLFIALDFIGKGGPICVKAFELLHSEFPEIQLYIIGEPPPIEFKRANGVIYKGKFNKNKPEELDQFLSLIANAKGLIHPTKKDVNPLTISEVGYYGVPAIASDRYAISELIQHGETGFLLSNPNDPNEIALKTGSLMRMPDEQYLELRKRVRSFHCSNFTWAQVGKKMHRLISRRLKA